MSDQSRRFRRLAVLLSVALSAVWVQTAEAGSYVQTTVQVAANSTGKGKVYLAYVKSGEGAPAAPTDGVWSNSTMMVKTSEGDRDALYDFYLYAQPNEGERFYGWSESDGGTDLGTDSPYVVKLQAPSDDGTTEKTYYASFAPPPTFTGGDAVDPHDWFKTGNWSGNEVPLSPDVAPILSSGTLAVFDPAGVGAPQTSVTNGAIRMGTENATAPSGLVINSGEFKPAELFIGAEPGSWGSVTQNNGTVAFLSNRFAIGYAASSEWSEFVLNDGTNNGARSDNGLSVGYDGRGRFIQNGGIYVQGGDVHVAERAGSAGEMYIRGGTFKLENNMDAFTAWHSNPIHLGEAESAYLEVGGAADKEGLVELEDGVEIANGSTVTVLTNGTLKVNYISAVSGTLLIDGGSLVYRHGRKATGKGDQNLNFVSGLTGFHVGAGGATIDDGGQTVVIHTPITADPALDGADCGQIVKRGSGTLVLPALGEGVSVLVEEGSVGISADNAFSPAQLVFPEGSSGACAIDLYGHELEWSDFAKVTEFRNTAADQAALVVDSDSDVSLPATIKLVGDIKMVKRGSGRLQMKDAVAEAVSVEEGAIEVSAGYRYYRVKCESLQCWLGFADGWAMSEFAFYDGDKRISVRPEMLSWDTDTLVDGKTHRDGCGPENLFDGDYETYMMDLRASAVGHDWAPEYAAIDACWFTLDFGRVVRVSRYVWYCGPDATKRPTPEDGWFYNVNDPTRLTLYGSDDGVTWTRISQDRFATENGEDKRSTNEAPVVGGEVTVANYGFGTIVASDGAELTATGGDYTVDGIHAGSGAVVSAPDGDIVFSGAQTFLSGAVASPIAVKSGTLSMTGDIWYRFEVRETSYDEHYCEMAELMLFDADGTLISGGLTDCGDEVAPANMPPGTVSQCGSYTHSDTEGPEKLFDGKYTDGNSSRWRETSAHPRYGDYLALVMRLPFGVRPAATYSWAMGYSFHVEDPTSWILEVSTDGVNWTTVSDSTDCDVTPRGNWVVSGPYDAAAPVWQRVNHLGAAATVRVDAGATLDVDTTATEIPGLVYDWEQGGGTITIFNPKAGGTLALVNVPVGTDVLGPLDYRFGTIENAANIKTWTVTVNGEDKARRLCFVDGVLTIVRGGLSVSVR